MPPASPAPEEEQPRLLVVGHGHAGGSVAATAAALGLPTTIWGRRDLAAANPLLAESVVARHPTVAFEAVDVADPGAEAELTQRLEAFDWVVLAHEPRPLGPAADGDRAVDGLARLYEALAAAGPSRIVRVGSLAAEDPAIEVTPRLAALPYFAVKARLAELAASAVASGLPLLTVAPAEIHSPWSTYGDRDPYRIGLGRLAQLPAVHDLPSLAVSDTTLGRAVLAAAAAGEPGAFLPVADAPLGPGRALVAIAEAAGRTPPRTCTWDRTAALHLLAVLVDGATLDPDLVSEHTAGLDAIVESGRIAARLQQEMAALSLWWAGPAAQERARQVSGELSSRAATAAVRAAAADVGPELLAILLATGAEERADGDPGLAGRLRERVPGWADALTPDVAPGERERRLADALRRQSLSLTGDAVDALPAG